MKKLLTICSSLLIVAGLKAQTTTPAVKKETVKPGTVQPGVTNDSLKNVSLKQANQKDFKFAQLKKAPVVEMKEAPAVAKPHKG